MKKTIERNRIARVFTKYIRLGLYRKNMDVFSVCKRIRGACSTAAEANALFAAWETCRLLRAEGKREELECFLRIYVFENRRYIKETESTVLRCAYNLNLDPRTIYRRLQYVEQRYKTIKDSLN